MGQFIITKYDQVDKIVVKFPFTDGSQFKKRPALVISNNKLENSDDWLIVQITSKLNKDGLSVDINDKDCLRPLPLKSYIRLHKIFTVHHSLIYLKLVK